MSRRFNAEPSHPPSRLIHGRAQTGSAFVGLSGDQMVQRFAILGYLDWRLWAIASALCDRGSTIVEIGANIGIETVGYSDIVGEHGRVLAFEPVPANVDALRRCVAGFRHRNVDVRAVAIAERQDSVRIAVPPGAPDRARMVGAEETPDQSFMVECVTLDSLSSEIGKPRMLIVDVEGSEVLVLRGARDVLSRDRPVIVIEANPTALADLGFGVEDLRNHLTDLGYAIKAIARLGLTEPSTGDFPGYENWLCVVDSSSFGDAARQIRRCALLPAFPRLHPLTRPRYRPG